MPSSRRELQDFEIEEISRVLSTLKRGDLIEISYYDGCGYRNLTSVVLEVVDVYKLLRFRKECISFNDICKIRVVGQAE